jgi:hypothetical protein
LKIELEISEVKLRDFASSVGVVKIINKPFIQPFDTLSVFCRDIFMRSLPAFCEHSLSHAGTAGN